VSANAVAAHCWRTSRAALDREIMQCVSCPVPKLVACALASGVHVAAQGDRGITMRGVIALENQTLRSPPLEGVVLRYGQLYGPGTRAAEPPSAATMPVHVDSAAFAALRGIDHGKPGVFNIAEPNGHVATDKARPELQWSPDFRLPA
jgi:hypothetical protein